MIVVRAKVRGRNRPSIVSYLQIRRPLRCRTNHIGPPAHHHAARHAEGVVLGQGPRAIPRQRSEERSHLAAHTLMQQLHRETLVLVSH